VAKKWELNNEYLGSIKDHEILDQLCNKDTAANISYTVPETDKNFCVCADLASNMSVG
jgi:hypothetical protein